MNHDQFTLPFLDTTIVAEGFGLYGGFPTAKSSAPAQMNFEPEEAEVLDASDSHKPSLQAKDYRLAGDRVSPRAGKRAQRTISPRSSS